MVVARVFPRWTILLAVLWAAGGWRIAAAEAVSGRLELTASEQAWVAAHPRIRVGMDPAWPPFSTASASGECSGIDVDLLALLGKRIGVKFEVGTDRSWPAVYDAAKAGRFDLLAGTARTPERAEDFRFTAPYLSFPIVIVTRNDEPILWSLLDLTGRRIIGVRGYAPTTEMIRAYPMLHFTLVDTVRQAMEEVSDGDADAFITNLPNASFVAKTRGLTNLKIAGVLPEQFDLHYAVRKDWPELVGLLDRAIASLTEAERQAVVHPWIRVDYERVIRWDLVWKTAAIVLSVLGTVLGAVIYHNRRLARELEERIRLQREIKEAHDELLRLNEDKTEMLQMAAHDLRGPLTGMQLAIDTSLRLNAVPHDKALGILERQVKQMTGLLNDLLDIEALEHGRREFRMERISPAAKFRESLAAAMAAAAAKTIRIETEIADGLPEVRVDATALKQIYDNLLSNAVKFAPVGSEIAVRLARHNGYVRLEVRDQGPGVQADETERIFAKYARGRARPTGGEKSTGLGLSIVRQLAAAMNARVWCENRPEGGGLFVMMIPAADAEAPADEGRAAGSA